MPKTTWTPVTAAEAADLYPVETCPGPDCGRPIRRMLTVGLKRRPVEAEPVEDATFVVRRDPAGDVRAHVIGGGDLRDDDETTWRDHWLRCPNAPRIRRPKGRRKGSTCMGCYEPLDDVDVKAGHVYHSCCEPADIRDIVAAQARATQAAVVDGQATLL